MLLLAALLAGACTDVPRDELAERYPGVDQDEPVEVAIDDGETETVEETTTSRAPLPISWFDCPFVTEHDVECGYILIPDRPPVADVAIAFARFRSSNPDKAPDPVVFLHGGPGSSILSDAGDIASRIVDPFIRDRDVIVYDQRGAGLSSPLAPCTDAWRQTDPYFQTDRLHSDITPQYVFELGVCAGRYRGFDEFDLSSYNSAGHTDDLIRLLEALRYQEVNLFGVSYGSRLAQTVLREHPDRVRAAILSGVYPIDENLIGSVPQSFERALTDVFAACADNRDCSTILPDPFATLERVIADLDAEPRVVPIATDIGGVYDLWFAGDEFLALLHRLLYTANGAAVIPDVLAELDAGIDDRLQWLAPMAFTEIGDIVAGLAVQCHEEVPFTTADELQRSADRELFDRIDSLPGIGSGNMVEICESWTAVGQAPPVANEPVVWDAPTLAFAGGFDPITPPEWAEIVVERLPNATLVEVTDRGHDADEGWCARALMSDFIDDPDATLDPSCGQRFEGPLFPNAPLTDATDEVVLTSSPFDVDPTTATTWIDMELPRWPAAGEEGTRTYWRGVDVFDPTVIVVRHGPLDRAFLFSYLRLDPVEQTFQESATPSDVAPGWRRFRYNTVTLDIVSYVLEAPYELTISVVAYAGDLETLERDVIVPMVNSVSASVAEE